eukprot:1469721-Heterocapsa_arctica.AAC.1
MPVRSGGVGGSSLSWLNPRGLASSSFSGERVFGCCRGLHDAVPRFGPSILRLVAGGDMGLRVGVLVA